MGTNQIGHTGRRSSALLAVPEMFAVTAAGFLFLVMPWIEGRLKDAGGPISPSVLGLISASHFVIAHGYYFLLLAIALLAAWRLVAMLSEPVAPQSNRDV